MKEINKLTSLFLTFLKIGAFTFGGGYAMIPLIQKEIVGLQSMLLHSLVIKVPALPVPCYPQSVWFYHPLLS